MKKVSILLAAALLVLGGNYLVTASPTPAAAHPTTISRRFPSVEARDAFFKGRKEADDWYNAAPRTVNDVQLEYYYAMDERQAAEDGSLDDFFWSGYSEHLKATYCNGQCN